jgi:hypothetical protein
MQVLEIKEVSNLIFVNVIFKCCLCTTTEVLFLVLCPLVPIKNIERSLKKRRHVSENDTMKPVLRRVKRHKEVTTPVQHQL